MDCPRPPSVTAPSIWYAAVDAPHWKSAGNAIAPPNVKVARTLLTRPRPGKPAEWRSGLCATGPDRPQGIPNLSRHDELRRPVVAALGARGGGGRAVRTPRRRRGH